MRRHFWVLIHHYAGLYLAFFLVVAGLTGSILAFYHPLDRWLNPEHHQLPVQPRAMLDPLVLRDKAQALVPQAEINEVVFRRVPSAVYSVMFGPRTNPATQQPFELDYNMIRLNPYTGELLELSKEGVGYWPLTRKNLLGFIYALHYQLALGETGQWLFGVAAVIWTLDCFVGFYLTLPAWRVRSRDIRQQSVHVYPTAASCSTSQRGFWQRWAIAWKVKWRASRYRLNFDLHRAGGLWTWLMLFIFAWSSVGFNMHQSVYLPVMHGLFGMPDFQNIPRPPLPQPNTNPKLDWYTAHAIGQRLMAMQGLQAGFTVLDEDFLVYDPTRGVFVYTVRSDLDFVDEGGITTIYFDGNTGTLVGEDLPTGRNIGVTIAYWLTSLHMAHVFGLPYRLLVCLMGLVVTLLSVTGVYLWWKKRQAALQKTGRAANFAD